MIFVDHTTSMKQELSNLMIKCAELAMQNDKLEIHICTLNQRIEDLRAALGCIEDVYPSETDLAPHMARQALDNDTKFAKDEPDEQ